MSIIINNIANINKTIEYGKELHSILQNNNETEIIEKLMKQLFAPKKKEQFTLLNNNFKSSYLGGKSGASILFHIDDNVNLAMKKTETEFSKKYLSKKDDNHSIYYDKNCIKLRHDLNEIILNLVMNNLNLFIKGYDSAKFDKYILKLFNFGIYNDIKKKVKQTSYIVQERVGITYIDLDTYNKYSITNLHELFAKNYIPILVNLCKNVSKNMDVLKIFVKYLTHMIKSYNKLLSLLTTELGFCHGDMKMTNVFIKKYLFSTQENPSFKEKDIDLLKYAGFIIDILPVISDLDKSSLYINKKIRPYRNWENIIINFNYLKQNSLLYKFRHECSRHLKICNTLYDPSHFDTLNIIINMLLLLNTNINGINILKILNNHTINNNNILIHFYTLIKKVFSTNSKGVHNLITNILKTKKTTLITLKKHISVDVISNKSEFFLCTLFKKIKNPSIILSKSSTKRKTTKRKTTKRKTTKRKTTKRKTPTGKTTKRKTTKRKTTKRKTTKRKTTKRKTPTGKTTKRKTTKNKLKSN